MAYIYCNPNPARRSLTDCTVRAISKILMQRWEDTYLALCEYGLMLHDMPSTNHVWGTYLLDNGFKRYAIPNTCPDCYTVEEFTKDYPNGKYILATGSHVIAVIDGDYFDTSDSGHEVPVYFYVQKS